MTQKHPDYLTVLMRYAREREDRWRTLQRDARTALRHPSAKATDGLRRELSALRDLEEYWAFPGPAVIARLFDALSHGDMALLDTALGNISAALHTKSYRRTPDLDLFVHHGPLDEAMPMTGSTDRPDFEVLTVTTATPEDRAEISRSSGCCDPRPTTSCTRASSWTRCRTPCSPSWSTRRSRPWWPTTVSLSTAATTCRTWRSS